MSVRKVLAWVLAAGAVAVLAFYGLLAYREHASGTRFGRYRVAEDASEEVTVAMGRGPAAARLVNEAPPGARPRNIIFLLADGLGFQQLAAARIALAGPNGRLFVERFPAAGWSWTHSLEELYTDSAAGASALATGHKTLPLMLSQTPGGEPRKTLLEAGLERGMRAAMITTTTIFDASPAAFLVHHRHRRDYPEVTRQLAAGGVELLISEGVDSSEERWQEVWPTILGNFDDAGYRIVGSWDDLVAASRPPLPEAKLLALLPPGSLSERRDTPPALADLADLALQRLAGAQQGFFLFIEEEDTDTHSHHANLDRVIAGVAALDEAARRAVDFARADGQTLVLLTSDHETGALTLIGGKDGGLLDYRWISGNHSAAPVPVLAFGPGAERFSGVLDNTEIPRILAELLGLDLS